MDSSLELTPLKIPALLRAFNGLLRIHDVGLVEEVAGLRSSLDRLVVLMERVAEQQRIDLLLRRVELKERRLIPVASDLRSLEGDYEDQKAQVKRYQEMLAQMEDRVIRNIGGASMIAGLVLLYFVRG